MWFRVCRYGEYIGVVWWVGIVGKCGVGRCGVCRCTVCVGVVYCTGSVRITDTGTSYAAAVCRCVYVKESACRCVCSFV